MATYADGTKEYCLSDKVGNLYIKIYRYGYRKTQSYKGEI